RDLALELGVYGDDAAKGCHDWDTFFRFVRTGHAPVHVPEVLYSWRMHPQSCSGNVFSKSYVFDSHRHVLGDNLRALPPPDGLTLLVSEGVRPTHDEWPWEAMGLVERFPDTAVVGGRLLHPDGTLWSAGEVIGFESLVGSPDRGRHALDPGYFAWLKKQRTV